MPHTATRTAPPTEVATKPTADLATLTETQVANQTDSGSFSRGHSYHRSGRIFDPVRRGAIIQAQCHGSSGGPYGVTATLATADQTKADNPVEIGCDCPRGGFCKHVVALLLTWIDAPERFVERPPVADLLAAKSREELATLIELMLKEAPDLESLLELPTPVAGAPDAAPIDEAAIRRQIAVALRDDDPADRRGRYDYNDDYYAGTRIAGKLERLVALGSAYADVGHCDNAVRLFATLVAEVAPTYVTVRDDDGELGGVLIAADSALAACLDGQGRLSEAERVPPDDRARLIKALYEIWLTDIESGGHDLSQEGPDAIARSATPVEQRRVGGWLREIIRPSIGDDFHQSWTSRAANGFLSLLEGEAGLSDEQLLAKYRGAELWEEAAETLIKLHRVDEALALAARRLTSAVVLTRFADRFVAAGDPIHVRQIIDLIDDRLWEQEGQNAHNDQTLLQWLEAQHAARGNPTKALDLARRRFKTAPSKATYDAVEAAARLPGHPTDPWPALRPDHVAALAQRGDRHGLIEIHLAAGGVTEALATLNQAERGGSLAPTWGWAGECIDARVARAAEERFPDDAVRIYHRLADRLIEGRQRPSYALAASFLARVKHVLETNERGGEWQTLIADLRLRNKSLRALREELDALGLAPTPESQVSSVR